MKKVLISMLMLAGGLQAEDVVCEWTGGETNPGSLADGAVSLTYDDSGAIRSLIATPVDGGTIAVTGDSMNFAANAKITVAAEGRLIISNAMDCVGDLCVTGHAGLLTRSWNDGIASTLGDPSQALLPTNSFKLMFADMNLDEWEPVEFRGDIPANIGNGWYFPNHFKAEHFKRKTVDGEKQMLVDLMARASDWVKAVRILLRQDGDNVCGKVIDAWYGGAAFLRPPSCA